MSGLSESAKLVKEALEQRGLETPMRPNAVSREEKKEKIRRGDELLGVLPAVVHLRAREVRVIGADGQQLGVLSLADALNAGARIAGCMQTTGEGGLAAVRDHRPRLVLLDTPDIDGTLRENWHRAELVRNAADVISGSAASECPIGTHSPSGRSASTQADAPRASTSSSGRTPNSAHCRRSTRPTMRRRSSWEISWPRGTRS